MFFRLPHVAYFFFVVFLVLLPGFTLPFVKMGNVEGALKRFAYYFWTTLAVQHGGSVEVDPLTHSKLTKKKKEGKYTLMKTYF